MKDKRLIMLGGTLVAVIIVAGALILNSSRGYQTLPYQVLEHGVYDNIVYIGNGRFYVSSGLGSQHNFGVYDFSQGGRVVIAFGQFNLPSYGQAIFKHGFVVADDYDRLIIKNPHGTEIARFDDAIEAYILSNDRVALRRLMDGLEHVSIVDTSGNELAYMYAQTAWLNVSVCGSVVSASNDARTYIFDLDGVELFILNRQSVDIQTMTGYDVIIVHDGNEAAMFDWQGNEIIPFGQFDHIWTFWSDFVLVGQSGKNGIVDGHGNIILPIIYEAITPVQGYDLFVVTYDGQRGVINVAGDEIVPFGIYDNIWMQDGYFFVTIVLENDLGFAMWTDWEVGVLDFQGNVVIPRGIYDSIFSAGNDRFIVRTRANNYAGAIDALGNYIIPFGTYQHIIEINYFSGAHDVALQRMSWHLISELHNEQHHGFIVSSGNFAGFYDALGNQIIPLRRYRQILHGPFNGLAVVESFRGLGRGLINIYATPTDPS